MPTEEPQVFDFDSRAYLNRLLPKDVAADPHGERLAVLLERIGPRRVPASSFSRIWLLGSRQAKLTCGYLAYWPRQCPLADGPLAGGRVVRFWPPGFLPTWH